MKQEKGEGENKNNEKQKRVGRGKKKQEEGAGTKNQNMWVECQLNNGHRLGEGGQGGKRNQNKEGEG